MTGDNPRILELRRRVQADPASTAFAQLAEECRRLGQAGEAVGICRAGLAFHPDYLAARVTLGRALLELGRLAEAETELRLVLESAPDNLPANRAVAELYQSRGQAAEAMVHYKRALELSEYEPTPEFHVESADRVAPSVAPLEVHPTPTAIEELFDFDRLLEQLGVSAKPNTEHAAPAVLPAPTPSRLDAVELLDDDADHFSLLERHLRESEEQRPYEVTENINEVDSLSSERESQEQADDRRLIGELNDWLAAIVADRDARPLP